MIIRLEPANFFYVKSAGHAPYSYLINQYFTRNVQDVYEGLNLTHATCHMPNSSGFLLVPNKPELLVGYRGIQCWMACDGMIMKPSSVKICQSFRKLKGNRYETGISWAHLPPLRKICSLRMDAAISLRRNN
jgi:hypothetical protein